MHFSTAGIISHKKPALVAMAAMAAAMVVSAQSLLSPQEGDLIFVSPAKPNAITQSTGHAAQGASYDHVAIFHLIGGKLPYVIEAAPPRVCLTPLDTLLANSPLATLARVQAPFDTTATIATALRFVGKPYDHYFEPDDSAIYCSELVQKSYKSQDGKPVFHTIPMSFHGSDGKILDYWTRRYAAKGKRVPEGEPGTNPNDMIHSRQVTIIGNLPTTK